MIDPCVPKRAKWLLTVPEEARVLKEAVTDVLVTDGRNALISTMSVRPQPN